MRHHGKLLLISIMIVAIAYATAILTTGVLASDTGWEQDGAQTQVNLSLNGDIRQPAIAISTNGEVITAWSNIGIAADRGIFFTIGVGQPVTPSATLHLTESQGEDAWAPDVAYHGDDLFVSWVQGNFPYPGVLMQQDGLTGTLHTIMDPVYGYTSPKLLVGNDRLFMFFASAANENDWSKADLYYTHRLFNTENWITPTIIITRAQANPPLGGIWYPDAALSDDSSTAHLVWEQTAGTLSIRGVWYTQGTWQAAQQDFAWAPLTRLSPTDQESVRPKIAVDSANRVHVAWIEQQIVPTGAETQATMQYISYRRLENGQWTPPLEQSARRLDPVPVQVNTYRPTWSNIAVDARGDTVCIAWHGYRGAPGASGEEEILLKCSQDGGKAWNAQTTNASETPDALSLFPALRLDANTTIHLAWEEHQGGLIYTTNYDTAYRQGALPKLRVYLPLVLKAR